MYYKKVSTEERLPLEGNKYVIVIDDEGKSKNYVRTEFIRWCSSGGHNILYWLEEVKEKDNMTLIERKADAYDRMESIIRNLHHFEHNNFIYVYEK